MQALGGIANESGTEILLFQFEALHQSEPLTDSASRPCGWVSWPGAKVPVASHAAVTAGSWFGVGWSPAGAVEPVGSQLIPMIGIATRVQGTLVEQPSEAFSAWVQTSKFAEPLPSSPVTPKVSLLGSAEPPTLSDSGA